MRVPETLPSEVLKKMGAPDKNPEHKVATPADLEAADGIIFGIPTRFGMAAAQVKALIDSTGGIWMKGKLVGKPAAMFVSTGTQGGGQETTALTFVTQLVHHGMVFVPIGYACPKLFDMSEPHGGSPYGAGTLAGPDGKRQPSKLELEVAEFQGKHFTGIASKLAA
uniref:Flavodoxin-like domain-containing protein n=1 Tax=Lotharella oceanica TaxID=641309 RepID=A0A7S2TF08_9EUKA|mmetsp:Transcript_10970/g.21008  ORF Transcript_10970/g.21008 Transcript_10970/m.21008 type:complete len:166 (+) Transcript_10970:2-499(+)